MMTAPRISYVSEAVISCRLRGIYGSLCKENYKKTCDLINEILWVVRDSSSTCDMDLSTLNMVVSCFYLTLVEIAMKRYTNAHNNIRELYYKIEYKN